MVKVDFRAWILISGMWINEFSRKLIIFQLGCLYFSLSHHLN